MGTVNIDELLSQVKGLSRSDLERFGSELPGKLDSGLLPYYVKAGLGPALSALPTDAKADALTGAIREQPEAEQKRLTQQVGASGIGGPGEKARDRLWLTVVGSFATVLVGAFITLALGVFFAANGTVKPELILTMFTSVVGFLAGLFVPSPMANRGGNGGS